MLNRLRAAALVLFMGFTALSAESVEDRIKATDLKDPEAVFALAQWCAENGQPSRSRRFLNDVIKLDPDHYGAREALGQVKVNDRWVSARFVDGVGGDDKDTKAAGQDRRPTGPGPKADAILWDLTLPRDPKPDSTWINQYVDRMNTVGNDSRDMDISVATMLAADHFPVAIPRLAQAMTRADWKDLYGASMIVMELMRKGDMRTAKSLLPFLAVASARADNAEDLYTFGYVVGALRDKRIVPRLIAMLSHSSDKVQEGGREGLAQITLLPLDSITVESATRWWDLNHALSDRDVFKAQLRENDDGVVMGAAKALYEYRDGDIVPVLARLMRSEDRRVRADAIHLVERITGSDWSFKVEGTPEDWKRRSDELAAWWKENEFRHTWIEDQGKADQAATDRPDPHVELVRKLGSITGNEADAAETALIGAGDAALPAVLEGLRSGNRILRRRAYAVLTGITRHNLPFDAAGDDASVAAEIAAWEQWLIEAGRMPDPDAADVSKEAAE